MKGRPVSIKLNTAVKHLLYVGYRPSGFVSKVRIYALIYVVYHLLGMLAILCLLLYEVRTPLLISSFNEVSVSLNLACRCHSKSILSDIDALDYLVRRQGLVYLVNQLSVKVVNVAAAHLTALLLQKLVVWLNISCNNYISDCLIRHTVNYGFLNQFVFLEDCLKLFRKDVLSALCHDYGLLSTGQIEEVIGIQVS